MRPIEHPTFTQALKQAEQLKQRTMYQFKNNHYMIVQCGKNYAVQLFSWGAQEEALKNDSLLIII
jgi:hypothetical protein